MYNAEKQQNPDDPALRVDAYPGLTEDSYDGKLYSVRYVPQFREDYGLYTRVARFHNVYGPFGTWAAAAISAGRDLRNVSHLGHRLPDIETWARLTALEFRC